MAEPKRTRPIVYWRPDIKKLPTDYRDQEASKAVCYEAVAAGDFDGYCEMAIWTPQHTSKDSRWHITVRVSTAAQFNARSYYVAHIFTNGVYEYAGREIYTERQEQYEAGEWEQRCQMGDLVRSFADGSKYDRTRLDPELEPECLDGCKV